MIDFKNSELETGYNIEDNTWEVIVKYHGDILKFESISDVEVEILSEQYAIITLKQPLISWLSAQTEIEHIELPKRLQFVLRDALDAACIAPVQSQTSFGLSGKGTLIGIIDSGIDYTHPDFRNDNGHTRIKYIWDQAGQGIPPQGFKGGAEYNETEINTALSSTYPYSIIPDMDYIGHGTAVAGVAAGNGRGSVNRIYRGSAPEASLIVVRLGRRGQSSFARTTELMRALKYVIDKAEFLEMPIAVNISYGTNDGSHDGNSLFEGFMNDIAQRWKNVIVVASGNEGAAAHHYRGILETNETRNIDFYTTGGLASFYLTLWKNFIDVFSIELILPSGVTTGQITYADHEKVIYFNNVAVYINYGQPRHYNVDQNIFIQIEATEGRLPEGLWQLRIKADEIIDGSFDIWLPIIEEVSLNTAFFIPYIDTTLTLPSTAFYVITVGAYNSHLNSIADFSGRGYTRSNIYVKPDLVAPGVDIMSSNKYGGYGLFTGTSIAAPFVTGSAALMMQWGIVEGNDPFLYGERIKAFLRLGARRQNGMNYPNQYWGYGTLCLKNTMDMLISYIKGGI
ncbi:S8 family peptidase [Sedimentibacter hydroxybenzoicus DSM 7310]|uniref:S8 family peptidase n=1 Tax=Sedimentibacter hydroxybenzoicus DSM 7310 TaxID=1123245 RepID=A0A974BMQ0_SEDHY|nr:S8 family peptidase [Sedimentibacter hydroxybenzoicus]NYB75897.1 S8 family peptidase [Sedimentibacter hydroxybenzoicus DSM 7310]